VLQKSELNEKVSERFECFGATFALAPVLDCDEIHILPLSLPR